MTETPAPYGPVPSSDFESQYRRVFESAECKTQIELAAFLEVRQSSISDARRRKSIPSDWLVKLLKKKHINPDWISCGTGAKFLVPANSKHALPHVTRITEVRPPQECSAQELFNELVRSALKEPDIRAIGKEVAASWLPIKKSSR